MTDPKQIYHLFLKLYPARFREEYEAPLERQFADEYREAWGPRERAALWLRALTDLATSIPAEILREMRQDLRYAVRIYRSRSPATALALTALALAIGATTGVFSVLNALLIRSLPFQRPERLVEVQMPPVSAPAGRSSWYGWRAGNSYLQDAATYSSEEINLGLAHSSVRVAVAETSANFFALLGAEPILGRAFAAGEDAPGSDGVAVIGYGLWQQSFGGDPRVLGTTIDFNGVPMVVIGVASPAMDFPARTAVWTPTVFDWKLAAEGGRHLL